ncbi:MAG: cytochrome c soxX [Hyphomicrobiales bacterium]|nr:cytochrome c soxX [Hyphomicrobiales bacterium]
MRALAVAFALLSGAAYGQALAPFQIEDGEIRASLTGQPGDPARGRAIVGERQKGLCLLCHKGPFPETPFQGDLAPTLNGVGARLSEGALRLRMVDGANVNPQTIMPAYYRVDGLTRVAPALRGKPLLNAQEIEDVVAYLLTLKDGDAPGRLK